MAHGLEDRAGAFGRTPLGSPDELRPLYRAVLGLGVAAVLILALGLAFFLHSAPPGEHSGLRARILGVYAYDPATGILIGEPRTRFSPDERFAARVDWGALPPELAVGARWYGSLGEVVGGVGPASAGELAAEDAPVPEQAPPGLAANLPGRYTLLVLRFSRGRPVEILGRSDVYVERSE